MEITTSISIWLQLNHNGSSNLFEKFSKLNFLAILGYHNGFLKKNKKQWNFHFQLICIILFNAMKPEKLKSLSEVKNEIYQLKNAIFLLF